MTLRLHWSPDSANLPVRIALEMFGLSYETIKVDRAAQEHRSEAFLEKNPQGLIPVLEDGGLILFETGAILWHLAEKVGRLGPDAVSFGDDVERATALKWMFYLSNTVHADLRMGFNPQRYISGDTEAAALLDGVAARIGAHFDLIETEMRSNEDERSIQLQEIYLATLARWAQLYPRYRPIVSDLSHWPAIFQMCRRLEANPNAQRAFNAESIPPKRAITSPRPPDLPLAEVTGT